ncbi:hypothetical protein Tco_0778029 [Tanacetum coccineum]
MASGGSDQDAEYALSKLLQMGTVAGYQNEFEMLIKRVTISESLLNSFYISGLTLDLQCLLLSPKTLDKAFSLAHAAETRFTNLYIWEFLWSNPSTLGEDFFKARITEAHFRSIAEKEQNIPEKEDTTLSLPSEEVSLGLIMRKVFPVRWSLMNLLGSNKNEPVDSNEGKSLNLVVVANDVGNNGFSAMDHQWQGDFFATGGVAQVDTWNHNRSQPVNTFEWGSGSVRCNLGEPNIVATYGNDMCITNYGLRLKDEAIKKLKEITQILKGLPR